jgi:Fic family protein
MRTYEQTHPWLRFQLDLTPVSPKLWLLLGEAQSKCEHVAGVPLLPAVADRLYQLFLAKGVLATTAIEGNTLSEPQVLELLRGRLKLPESKEYLRQEVENVVKACNEIGDLVLAGELGDITSDDVKDYNHLVLLDLPLEEGIIPGQIRTYDVRVGSYRGAPPEDCDHLLDRLCAFLNGETGPPAGLSQFALGVGILRAILAHLYIAWIHPFGDGNGRTARLLEFRILLSAGVPATAAHLLSNHYNQTRAEYYRQLDFAHRSGGNILPFIEYALQGFVDGLTEQIATIRDQQQTVLWINYVHDRFRGKRGEASSRRRRLAIDLAERTDPVPVAELPRISPDLADAYATRGDRTVRRDVNVLAEMGLVEIVEEGVRAKPEAMRAFLPPKVSGESV